MALATVDLLAGVVAARVSALTVVLVTTAGVQDRDGASACSRARGDAPSKCCPAAGWSSAPCPGWSGADASTATTNDSPEHSEAMINWSMI